MYVYMSPVNPLYPNISYCASSPHYSLYNSYGALKENLSNNQGLYKFGIISLILINFMFDVGVILLGEITCLSLLGVKGLIRLQHMQHH